MAIQQSGNSGCGVAFRDVTDTEFCSEKYGTSHSGQRDTSRSWQRGTFPSLATWHPPSPLQVGGTHPPCSGSMIPTCSQHGTSLFPACRPLEREAFHLISIYRRILTSYRGFTNRFWQLYRDSILLLSTKPRNEKGAGCRCVRPLTSEPLTRLELATCALRMRCSTD